MARTINLKNRERILGVAEKMVHRHGYHGVSMDDIATAAKIKKANLFHYYASKEELGLAVFEYATRGFQERWTLSLNVSKDPIDVVAGIFSDARRFMKEEGCSGGCLIGNLAQELSDTNEVFRKRVSKHLSSWRDQLAGFLTHHQKQGYFVRSFDAPAAAQGFLALFQGALLCSKANRDASFFDGAGEMIAGYFRAARPRPVARKA